MKAGGIPLIRAARTFSPGRRKGVAAGITCLSPTGERSRSAKRAGGEGRAARRRQGKVSTGRRRAAPHRPCGPLLPGRGEAGRPVSDPHTHPPPIFPGRRPGTHGVRFQALSLRSVPDRADARPGKMEWSGRLASIPTPPCHPGRMPGHEPGGDPGPIVAKVRSAGRMGPGSAACLRRPFARDDNRNLPPTKKAPAFPPGLFL